MLYLTLWLDKGPTEESRRVEKKNRLFGLKKKKEVKNKEMLNPHVWFNIIIFFNDTSRIKGDSHQRREMTRWVYLD